MSGQKSVSKNVPRAARDKKRRMILESEEPTTAGAVQNSSDDTVELDMTCQHLAEPARDPSDDTIELEMTGEERQALLWSAEAARSAEAPRTARRDGSSPALSLLECRNSSLTRTARIDRACNVTFAVAALSIATVFLWPTLHWHPRHPPAPRAINARTVAPPHATAAASPPTIKTPAAAVKPPEPVAPQVAPLRIRNAFDAAEVFEFAPGTPEAEAREEVAELLLNRARDRGAAGRPRPRVAVTVNQPALRNPMPEDLGALGN